MTEPVAADAIRVEHIGKSFGAVTALVDLSMHLAQGECLGLIGDNGAGKSTLIKILSGFQRPDRGAIFVQKLDWRGAVADKPIHRRRDAAAERCRAVSPLDVAKQLAHSRR